MIRETSVEAYNKIKENGLLSKRRWQVYDVLFHNGPATAMELRNRFPKGTVDSQIRARLNELRDLGVVHEKSERECRVTGMRVIEWEVTDRLPVKFDKPHREKCKTCNGKGYVETQQARLL